VPQGWKYQNTPQQVQMAPADGKAMIMLSAAKGASLEDAANGFLQQNNLQFVDSKETTVNGLKAIALLADTKTQEGQQQQPPLRTQAYLIQYGELIYLVMGLSAAPNFSAYAPQFTNTQQSFKELTDAEKINKKPERIQLRTAKSNTTLEKILRDNNIEEKRLEELAIVNGMMLTDEVKAGTMIKVVERK
jgi:predicted Zn-dependent protease